MFKVPSSQMIRQNLRKRKNKTRNVSLPGALSMPKVGVDVLLLSQFWLGFS